MRETFVPIAVLCFLLLGIDAIAIPITIDFEDAPGHDVLLPSNHYPGLTITNGVWIQGANLPFGTFNSGSGGLGVNAGLNPVNNWAFPGVTSPIVIVFDSPVANVSIQAFDVGGNGAQLLAFSLANSLVGLVSAVGVGIGTGNHPLLSIAASNIARIELRQPLYPSGESDGLGWDNLSFRTTAVTEPATFLLLIGGLASGLLYRRAKVSNKEF